MPVTVVQQTHVLVVILFLILFIIKAFLLFTGKHNALNKIKKSTKVLDIIFGTLILVSGGYLLFAYNGLPTWLMAKVALVLAAIPVSIVGIKKHSKPLVAIGLVLFIYIYGISDSKSLTMKNEQAAVSANEVISEEEPPAETENAVESPAITSELTETSLSNAKAIYVQTCANCHGEDGTRKAGNAAILSRSQLPLASRKAVILNGKGTMPGYQGQISEQEAEELAAYTLNLN